MDKSCDTSKRVASSTKVTKYALCQMPADWATLPVHPGIPTASREDCVAVYTKSLQDQNLVYEGYICPFSPAKLCMSGLQPPPKEESFAKKYARLLEKIRAEEAEAEAQGAKIISEDERNSVAHSAASREPEQGVVRAQPSTTPSCEDAAEYIPEHLNQSIQRTKSNNDYPLPEEILDRRESLLLEGTGEFICCFEDMDFWNSLCANPVPSEEFDWARPVDTSCTPADGESSPLVFFGLG